MQVSKKGADILLSTKAGKASISSGKALTVEGEKTEIIDWPGEYEISGFSVRTISAPDKSLAIRVTLEGIRLFFPPTSPLASAEEELPEIGEIDVLFVCAESSEWTKKDWKKFIEEVDPRMVVFGETGEKTIALQKEIGSEEIESVEKTDISHSKFSGEKTVFLSLS
ncbi:hypothetical protein IPN35_04755 [Candidatus Peregrinibacteria bacterium]|nr:MAG: hypothetical protein IPN35_04755 [Candidatus Peregrinibacteria bacterium]